MRGGVTRRRKVADLAREVGLGHGGSLNTRIKEFVRPAQTNQSIHAAVQDYLNGGARKRRIVEKYGEISNWDTSIVAFASVTAIASLTTHASREGVVGQWGGAGGAVCEDHFWSGR